MLLVFVPLARQSLSSSRYRVFRTSSLGYTPYLPDVVWQLVSLHLPISANLLCHLIWLDGATCPNKSDASVGVHTDLSSHVDTPMLHLQRWRT